MVQVYPTRYAEGINKRTIIKKEKQLKQKWAGVWLKL
jgi:hypothetical protein